MLAQYHNDSDTEMLMHSLFDRSVFLGVLGIRQTHKDVAIIFYGLFL